MVGGGNYLMAYHPNNDWFNNPGNNKGTKSGPGSWATNNTTLTINQIPSHTHKQRSHGNDGNIAGGGSDIGMEFLGTSGVSVGETFATGGSQGHNHFHVSPYFIVVVWQRTA